MIQGVVQNLELTGQQQDLRLEMRMPTAPDGPGAQTLQLQQQLGDLVRLQHSILQQLVSATHPTVGLTSVGLSAASVHTRQCVWQGTT